MMSPDDERAQPYPTHSFSSPLASHKSSSSSFGSDKAPSEPEIPPTSMLSSPPIPKQDMHPLSGVNSSSSARREEYRPSTKRSMPSQRAYEVSPHAPEYTLFPTIYKQLPP